MGDSIEKRVAKIEWLLNTKLANDLVSLFAHIKYLKKEMKLMQKTSEIYEEELKEKMETSIQEIEVLSHETKARVETFDANIDMLLHPSSNGGRANAAKFKGREVVEGVQGSSDSVGDVHGHPHPSKGHVTMIASLHKHGVATHKLKRHDIDIEVKELCLEEIKIMVVHRCISLWASILLQSKFSLRSTIYQKEGSTHGQPKRRSSLYARFKEALEVYDFIWIKIASYHEEMNAEAQPQPQKGMVMTLGENEHEMRNLPIGEDRGGIMKDAWINFPSTMEVMRKELAKGEGEQEDVEMQDLGGYVPKQGIEGTTGWFDLAAMQRQARLDDLVDKVCDKLRFKEQNTRIDEEACAYEQA
ncbi:hypothetical protein ACLB2K_068540 [Fragaria x ananassa]